MVSRASGPWCDWLGATACPWQISSDFSSEPHLFSQQKRIPGSQFAICECYCMETIGSLRHAGRHDFSNSQKMKTAIDLDGIAINGGKLREAREARNLSVAELAALVTLSRDQVKHIEEGGDRPFYTPAHKLLAVRKYADAMGLAYEEVVTGPDADQTVPAPEDASPSMLTSQEGMKPADLRLAAVDRNTEIRRLALIGVITLTILIAVYAKVRGSKTDMNEQDADPAQATAEEIGKVEVTPPLNARSALPKTSPADTAQVAKISEAASQCPVPTAPGDPRVWSPTYQYKADLRLFMISTKEDRVCVTDSTGKEAVLTLKPMVWQVFAGKPPYEVRSAQLRDHKLYLQGHLVRVPADTQTMRLIPTQIPPPAPNPTPTAAPASAPSSSENPDA